MPKNSIRRILLLAGAISLLASYLGIWQRLITDPAERTGADFIHFYSAGRIAQTHGAAHVYDLELQHDIEEEQVGFPLAPEQVLPYNHMPFLIPILQAVVDTDYPSSFSRWVLLMIVVYGLGVMILSRVLQRTGLDQGSIRIAALGSMLFLPFFVSLMNGQDTAFLLLGAAVWSYGLLTGRQLTAGLGLSLMTVRPHIALILALPMLFRHRRVFLGFVLGAGSLAGLSLFILGQQGTREFIDMLLLTAGGEWYGIKPYAMYSLIGLLTRAAPWLAAGLLRIFAWFAYGSAILALCVLWLKKGNPQNGIIGLSVTLALFFVPHLYLHDLALLLIPVYELIRRSGETGDAKISLWVTIPVFLSLLLLLANLSPFLQYAIPYLIMLALVLYFYDPKRVSHSL